MSKLDDYYSNNKYFEHVIKIKEYFPSNKTEHFFTIFSAVGHKSTVAAFVPMKLSKVGDYIYKVKLNGDYDGYHVIRPVLIGSESIEKINMSYIIDNDIFFEKTIEKAPFNFYDRPISVLPGHHIVITIFFKNIYSNLERYVWIETYVGPMETRSKIFNDMRQYIE